MSELSVIQQKRVNRILKALRAKVIPMRIELRVATVDCDRDGFKKASQQRHEIYTQYMQVRSLRERLKRDNEQKQRAA